MTTDPKTDRRLVAVVALASAVLAAACASTGKPTTTAPAKTQVLTVQQILTMTEQGRSFEEIMGEIQQTGTVYRLTDDQQQRLRGSSLSATLLSFMQPTMTRRPNSRAVVIMRRAGVSPPALVSLILMP